LFLDTEFTGLQQNTSLISLALIKDEENYFYAEFSDYRRENLDPWIKENVLSANRLDDNPNNSINKLTRQITEVYGDSDFVKYQLLNWIKQYKDIEIWADHVAYDWVLLCELFGGALNLPENISYIPFDVMTLLKLKGINPDTPREKLLDIRRDVIPHNALSDAFITRLIYQHYKD